MSSGNLPLGGMFRNGVARTTNSLDMILVVESGYKAPIQITKIKVSSDQEIEQFERKSHFKNKGGKNVLSIYCSHYI